MRLCVCAFVRLCVQVGTLGSERVGESRRRWWAVCGVTGVTPRRVVSTHSPKKEGSSYSAEDEGVMVASTAPPPPLLVAALEEPL